MEAIPVSSLAAATPAIVSAPRTFSRGQRIAFIVGVFLLSRLLIAVTAQVAWDHFGKTPLHPGEGPLPSGSLIQLFRRADTYWYADVADKGYHYQAGPTASEVEGNLGFYPVYPLLVRTVRMLVPDTLLAGHLVSNAMLLAACFLLWELARLELGSEGGAAWTVAFVLFCPGAAWFSMVFSESTFLLLLVAVIWGCRRERWLLAAGAGFLLALTRAVGVVAVVFVALEVWANWRAHRRAGGPAFDATGGAVRALAVAAPALGYLSFLAFLRWRFGDWHAQHNLMVAKWPVNAHLVTPWAAVAREWPVMHNSKRVIIYGLLLGGVLLSALSYPLLRRRLSYPALAFALLTMYVIATYHSPMARYLSVVVPIHLTLGALAVRSPSRGLLSWALLAASTVVMLGVTAAMVNGYTFY